MLMEFYGVLYRALINTDRLTAYYTKDKARQWTTLYHMETKGDYLEYIERGESPLQVFLIHSERSKGKPGKVEVAAVIGF